MDPPQPSTDRNPSPNRIPLPRINVENISDPADTIETSPQSATLSPPSPTLGRERSSSNLSASTYAHPYRERSMSGSTVAPSSPSTSEFNHGDQIPDDVIKSDKTYRPAAFDLDSALTPDPGTEADFQVENNCFAYAPGELNKMQNPKSLPAFVALGGLPGLERGLRTNVASGLSVDERRLDGRVSFDEASKLYLQRRSIDTGAIPAEAQEGTAAAAAQSEEAFADRIRVYKKNVLPEKQATPLWTLAWNAYKGDKILLLLTVAAIISLALGLYETLGVARGPDDPPSVDWVEGLAICIAIIIVILVGSLNDWQKERAFVRLSAKKEDREVQVIRSGRTMMIDVRDVLVGDVMCLQAGDKIPADGILIKGQNIKCDESSATGESDQIKKRGAQSVMELYQRGVNDPKDMDPFIISGSQVLEGVGTFLVTSVGVNSSYGKILMAMRQEMEATPLQVKLDGLATAIAKLGSSAAALLFFVLLFRFLGNLPNNTAIPAVKASQFLDILIVAVTVIVVAVPEGLPLAVTLALAFATTRMAKQNNLVRILKSCETMGNATTVCSDKTGTLTQNKMTVVAGTFGDLSFDDKNQTGSEIRSTSFAQSVSEENKRVLIDSIAINSTAFESTDTSSAETFIGSKTETALLGFARTVLGMGPLSEERSNATTVQILPFDSGRKCSGVVQRLSNGNHRFLVKGASEILLGYASSIASSTGFSPLDKHAKAEIEHVIDSYAQQSLRTIALVYRDFAQWPPVEATDNKDPSQADLDRLLHDMNFLGVVGIQDPVRPGVPDAVRKCQNAGVTVRMVTGDNVITAKAIATECGIYHDEGLVMEGPHFRTLSDEQMKECLPDLQVLARSSPEDKRILVTKLREMGEIVAVTGDGTNDGPALKSADIGFSMGIAGTEVAKEASAIILLDDNFASILTAIMWGRAVNDAVRKFLQFQITVNITAVLLTFISAVSSPEQHSVLTAVQLLWINLIMDSLAALALATDPPTEEILKRKPAPRTAPLFSPTMWKMIIGQSIFQLTVTLILYFAGPGIMNLPRDDPKDHRLGSIVFNTFVWMQIFNQWNNRRLDNKFNIFAGVHRNYFFIGINFIMVGAQVAIAYVGGQAFSITRINGWQWGVCLVLAALCLPWAVLVRLFPDEWFMVIARAVGKPILAVWRPTRRGCSSAWRAVKRVFGRGKGEKNVDESDTEAAAPAGGVQEKEIERQGQQDVSGKGKGKEV